LKLKKNDPLTPLAPKFPNFATQILLFRLKHTVAVVTHARVLHNFYTTWVIGVAFQKQRFVPKLVGSWARGASKYYGHLRISATVETSSFKFGTQLGLGLAYQKTTFRTKIGKGLARGASQQNVGPPTYFSNR